jgi:hypothetical protein
MWTRYGTSSQAKSEGFMSVLEEQSIRIHVCICNVAIKFQASRCINLNHLTELVIRNLASLL